MTIFLLAGLFIFIHIWYKRYIPVRGVDCRDWSCISGNEEILVIDIRDYQESASDPYPGAINIPFGYLKRHSGDIPGKPLHVIASTCLEKNLGIRFLRQAGFKVISFSITAERKCKEKLVSIC